MTKSDHLVKGLGLFGATSVVAGTMIGTAIFVVPSLMLENARTPSRVLLIWALAGVLSLFGALGYAELGAALPEAGGEYVYLHHAYGPGMGFLYGWTQFIVAKTASIAAIATGFLLYLAFFFPSLSAVFWRGTISAAGHRFTLALTGIQAGSAVMILLLSGINILGVRRSGAIQTLFTAAKILVLAFLIVLGLTMGRGSWANFESALGSPQMAGGIFAAWGLAMISALWAYDGWNNLSMVAGEVANPQRNIPVALIAGAILVGIVYILVNIAYFYVLTPGEAAATRTIAAEAARSFLGGAGGSFVAVGVLISTFATLNGSILAGSRIPYAQARDGLFPQALAKINERFKTPAAAIMAQAVIAGLFALSGRYETLYTKAIYSEWIFYALVTAGIFILRRREPDLPRPYRTWGYPVVPALFVISAVLLLAETCFTRSTDVLWCLALIGSGVPAYLLWTRRGRVKNV
ncbi:MAG TPA: amino acid permease [Terriglobia bacterium]|nr:amino acid permease [Terriglobia bacterium]